MAKTRYKGFSAGDLNFQGLNCKKLGLKPNYTLKLRGYSAKTLGLDHRWKNQEG
jgi:hypothetical protein